MKNYGERIEDFNETQLLHEFRNFEKPDWYGSTWPPIVIHTDMWDLVGGMSIEFSPGMYSDPDLSMKLWKAGVRYFKGLGKSKVYHFGSKSTKRVKKNIGQKTFLLKWGITARTFTRKYLKRGQPYIQLLTTPRVGSTDKIINKIKRIYNSF